MAKLAEIAFDMEQQAKRNAVSYRELGHGLALQLTWSGGQKVLRLSRPAVQPSEAEIEICRRLFRVPAEARRADDETSVELRWAV